MVDTSLKKNYKAKAVTSFEPIPEGYYLARVKEITEWKSETKDIMVIQKDENGEKILDERGKEIREKIANCKFYNCIAKLEIMDGEHTGRIIFHNLTTHPNMDFSIPNYLYGIGEESLAPSDIQETVGKVCQINVIIDTYMKTVQNKDTGIDEQIPRTVNRIKSFKPILDNEDIDDIGC